MGKYKTIKEVVKAVKSGELDESKLTIVQDNDCSQIYNGPCEDENGETPLPADAIFCLTVDQEGSKM